jgi:hypothetical protein
MRPKAASDRWIELAAGVVRFIALLTLLDKRDESLKHQNERDDGNNPPRQRPGAPSRDPQTERKYPSEEEHRSHAEAHWRKQILIEGTVLVLSAIAAGAAITAGIGAWYTYGQTKLAVGEAGKQTTEVHRQADAAQKTLVAAERPWIYIAKDTSFTSIGAGGKNVLFSVNLANEGESLARDVRAGGEIVLLHEPGYLQEGVNRATIPCDSPAGIDAPPRIQAIPPKSNTEGFRFVVHVGQDFWSNITPPRFSRRYFAGCIEYKWPSFNKPFHTYFLIPVTPVSSELRFDPDGTVTYIDLD